MFSKRLVSYLIQFNRPLRCQARKCASLPQVPVPENSELVVDKTPEYKPIPVKHAFSLEPSGQSLHIRVCLWISI